MRTSWLALLGVLFLGVSAQAQVAFQSFSWRADSRYELNIFHNNKPVLLKGDLRDGQRSQAKNLVYTADLKSFTTELFVVVAISIEGDDNAYLFLLERPNAEWIPVTNDGDTAAAARRPIKARKLSPLDDVEGLVTGFARVSNFTIAQSMRKMVQYFGQNPDKRVNDLYDAVERKDADVLVRVVPSQSRGNGRTVGVVQPGTPAGARQPTYGPPSLDNPNAPAGSPELNDEDLPPPPGYRRLPRPPASIPDRNRPNMPTNRWNQPQFDQTGRPINPPSVDEDDDTSNDWVARERARQRRALQERRRVAPQTDEAGQPLNIQPQQQPRVQRPRVQRPQTNTGGQLYYDPNTRQYYRLQQGQQPQQRGYYPYGYQTQPQTGGFWNNLFGN